MGSKVAEIKALALPDAKDESRFGPHIKPPTKKQTTFFRAWARGDSLKVAGEKAGYQTWAASSPQALKGLIQRHPDWCIRELTKAGWDKYRIINALREANEVAPLKHRSQVEQALQEEGVTLQYLARNLKDHLEAKRSGIARDGTVTESNIPDYQTQASARRDVIDVMGLRKQTVRHTGGVVHLGITLPPDFLRRQIERDRAFSHSALDYQEFSEGTGEIIEAEVEEAPVASEL